MFASSETRKKLEGKNRLILQLLIFLLEFSDLLVEFLLRRVFLVYLNYRLLELVLHDLALHRVQKPKLLEPIKYHSDIFVVRADLIEDIQVVVVLQVLLVDRALEVPGGELDLVTLEKLLGHRLLRVKWLLGLLGIYLVRR